MSCASRRSGSCFRPAGIGARINSSDIDVVMVGGRVVLEGGQVTLVDESAVVDRIRELAEQLYVPTAEAARRRELAGIMTPTIEALCRRWYSQPVGEPASLFNTKTGP